MTAPRRRWSFTLRLLFVVVTVLGISLGWVTRKLHWVRLRQDVLSDPQQWVPFSDDKAKSPPWPLGMFGADGLATFTIYPGTADADVERIRSLFPEARIRLDSLDYEELTDPPPATQVDRRKARPPH